MTNGLKVHSGEDVGKTIIFAYNHKHAERIVERFNQLYPERGADYCQLIDNQVKNHSAIIADFKMEAKMPQIAVSVDMLDTGIDVPEILNLVFFKIIKSKIKFEQMIGLHLRLVRQFRFLLEAGRRHSSIRQQIAHRPALLPAPGYCQGAAECRAPGEGI